MNKSLGRRETKRYRCGWRARNKRHAKCCAIVISQPSLAPVGEDVRLRHFVHDVQLLGARIHGEGVLCSWTVLTGEKSSCNV
jgi:hypothetical protein